MIGHAVDRDQFLILLADDTSDVLLDLLFVIRLNQALSSLNGEDNLNIDLGVGVGHVEFWMQPVISSNIPLRWSGETISLRSVYKHVAPFGAWRFPCLRRCHAFEIWAAMVHRCASEDVYSRLSREGMDSMTGCAQLIGRASAVDTLKAHTLSKLNRILSGDGKCTTATYSQQLRPWLERAISRATPTMRRFKSS